jgi:2Fe-2S ferredoxin
MVTITYRTSAGEARTVQAVPGQSLMEAARAARIPGILADCGGNSACGTCRIRVDEEWVPLLDEASQLEQDVLDLDEATPMLSSYRLSCQIPVRPDFDGLSVAVVEP